MFASIGFSVFGQTDSFTNFENFHLSQTSDVGSTACINAALNRPWTSIVYKIGGVVTDEQRRRDVCIQTFTRDRLDFRVSTAFLQFIVAIVPPHGCPCSKAQADRDFRFFQFSSSADGRDCYYGINFVLLFSLLPDGNGFVYRCCYLR